MSAYHYVANILQHVGHNLAMQDWLSTVFDGLSYVLLPGIGLVVSKLIIHALEHRAGRPLSGTVADRSAAAEEAR